MRDNIMLKKTILTSLIFGLFLPQVHAKNYYKWVDSKGNITYSSKPPPKGAKQQKIETLRSLGSTPAASTQRKEFKSNASIPDTYVNHYQSSNRTNYNPPRRPTRSPDDEALRQKIIKEASTPHQGAKGLTGNQLKTLAAMNGLDVPSDNSNSRNSYSAPQRSPSTVNNCDSSGCWGSDGTRYNKGAGATYFPSTGGSCQYIGGQMQCN